MYSPNLQPNADKALPELDDLQALSVMLSQRIEQWAEAYIATGEQRGLEKGREEGRQEGEARLLRRLLIRRFGPLPARAEQRRNNATESQLAAWSDAVLDAGSLPAVLGEPPVDH